MAEQVKEVDKVGYDLRLLDTLLPSLEQYIVPPQASRFVNVLKRRIHRVCANWSRHRARALRCGVAARVGLPLIDVMTAE